MANLSRDLDEYIQQRRVRYGYRLKSKKNRNSMFDVKKSLNALNEKLNKLLETIRETFRKKEVINLNAEEEIEESEIEDVENVDEENLEETEMKDEPNPNIKSGIITKIKEWIFKVRSKGEEFEEDFVEEVIELDYEELRQAFRIANSYLKKLPPAVLKAFKESDEYRVYYKVMEKLDLVKKHKSEQEK